MPTETANALRDGWLYTGDIAHMDEDGYFQIVDRKKDMILGAGGFNIYPREIEEVLYQHPKVKECASMDVGEGGGTSVGRPTSGSPVGAAVGVGPGPQAVRASNATRDNRNVLFIGILLSRWLLFLNVGSGAGR